MVISLRATANTSTLSGLMARLRCTRLARVCFSPCLRDARGGHERIVSLLVHPLAQVSSPSLMRVGRVRRVEFDDLAVYAQRVAHPSLEGERFSNLKVV